MDNKVNVAKKARTFFLKGTKKDTLNPLNYIGLGIIELFKSNDSLKADYYFSKANKLIPLKRRGLFASNKNKVTDLEIKALIKLETSELYSLTPRFNKSDSYNRILIELRPNLPAVYIAYGDIKLAQHKASEAIVLYKKALYLENTALTNVLIAKIYFLARNYFEAKSYYDKAIKLDSTFASAYSGLGDIYFKSDKLALSEINYAHFLKLTGNNILAKINYVKALYKANDYDATIKNALDILKADSTKTYLLRITAYSLVDKKDPELSKALLYMQKFFSKTPEEELITRDYIYYSKILLGLKRDSIDIRTGIEMLEKAYIADPSDKELLADLIKASFRPSRMSSIYSSKIPNLK